MGMRRQINGCSLQKRSVFYQNEKSKLFNIHILNSLSQKETGERLEISQMHVSRLQRKAIKNYKKLFQQLGGGVM